MTEPIHIRYTGEGALKQAILTVYGKTTEGAWSNTKALGGCLKKHLPPDSLVKTPRFVGFDEVQGRYKCELPVLLGPDQGAAEEALKRCTMT